VRGVLLLLALLALPLASAVPASVEMRVQPPLALEGTVRLAAGHGVVPLPAVQSLPVRAEHLNVTLALVDRGTTGTPAQGPAGLLAALELPPPLGAAPEERVRYLEMDQPQDLVVVVRQAQWKAVLAVGPYDTGALRLQGHEASVAPADAGALGLPAELAEPGGGWLRAEAAGILDARGTLRGLVDGLSLLAENGTAALQVDTTRQDRGEQWIALLRWTGASLSLRSDEPLALLAPALDLDLDGQLRGARAWGDIAQQQASDAARGEPVLARGRMQGTLRQGGGNVALAAQGDLAYLAVGDRREDFAKAAAAGLAAAGALAYAAQHLRVLAVPLYARVAPDELLDNDVRRRVHGHVRANPGADVKDTAAAVGVSWSTAAYHLHRLEREAVLLSRRAGRSKRFFLNGAQAPARADALGALRNPTTRAIAQLVASRPGLMQKEIGAALGLPASTVSWHMRRLRDLGVVREERKWRRAEYAAGQLWHELASALP
jgi:DNA-binding transcriptional ArsR family regulator